MRQGRLLTKINCTIKNIGIALLMLALMLPCFTALSVAVNPVWTPPPASPHYEAKGAVTGRVTTVNATQGISGAYIAIVNATNLSQEYYNTTSNEDGYYQLTGVNNTLLQNGTLPKPYVVYANKTGFGEGYSSSYGIEPSRTTTTAVIIYPEPANIELTAEKTSVLANGEDHTTITAYVTDTPGNPVSDGTQVYFSLNNTSDGMGSLNDPGSEYPASPPLDRYSAVTDDGFAMAEFGWVNRSGLENTITASTGDTAETQTIMAVG